MRWGACALASLLWVSAMTAAQFAGAGLGAVYALLVVPALASLALQRATRAQAWRWLVVLVLGLVVDQRLLSVYLLVTLTWALHRTWVSDRAPLRFTKESTGVR